MKVHEFMHEMSTTSAIFGRASGTRVIFEGDQAKTDGKNIYLPSLPQHADLKQEQVLAMRGFVDHEAGHIRHSDMPRIMSFYDKNNNNGRPELSRLHNALEDVWMEEKVLEEYPGSFKNLKQVNELVRSKEVRELSSMSEEERELALSDRNTNLQSSICVNKNPDFKTKHNELMRGYLSEKQDAMGKHYADLARECTDSNEVIELAKKVFQYDKETPPEEQSPEDFDNKAEAGELSDLEGEENEGENSEGYGQGKAEGDGESAEGEALTGETSEAHDEVGGIGSCVGKDDADSYKVYSTKDDILYKRGSTNSGGSSTCVSIVNDTSHRGDYDQQKLQLKSEVMTMKNKLRRAVMAKQQRDWDFGREFGRLDSKRLVAASQGVKQVWKRRTDREDYNTALTVLVDLSGSMHSSGKSWVARDCAIALSECFEGTGMSYRISGFCNKGGSVGHGKGNFHRYERLDHLLFKDFEDPLRVTRGSVFRIPEAVGGNNSDYDFVDKELYDLSKRTEKRKILFVLSDGNVACQTDYCSTNHERLIKENIKHYYQKKRIATVGIGILDSSVKRIYDKSVVVNNVGELSGVMFKQLTDVLVKEK